MSYPSCREAGFPVLVLLRLAHQRCCRSDMGRHTFATMMLTLDVDIFTTSKLFGHKNISTTQIYAKIIDQKKDEAVNRVNEIFKD